MSTEPFREMLDPELSVANSREVRELACPLLREIVNHATHAFIRCARAPDAGRLGGENEDMATFVLFRQHIELSDAIEVLFAQSCVDSAVPLLRSALEVSLALGYILQDSATYSRRSLAWTCANIYGRIEQREQLDPTTDSGRRHIALLAPHISVPAYDSTADVAELRRVLDRPEFTEINAEYQRRRVTQRWPKWYSLFGGPRDLRLLARHLSREPEYAVLYPEWSRHVHATETASWISLGNRPGETAFSSLRDARELLPRARMACLMLLQSTRLAVQHFRPGENLATWYLREVRGPMQRLGGTDVQLVEIFRDR